MCFLQIFQGSSGSKCFLIIDSVRPPHHYYLWLKKKKAERQNVHSAVQGQTRNETISKPLTSESGLRSAVSYNMQESGYMNKTGATAC